MTLFLKFELATNLLFSSEFAENGSICDYIHRKHQRPTLKQSLLWAMQVAEGIQVLIISAVVFLLCCWCTCLVPRPPPRFCEIKSGGDLGTRLGAPPDVPKILAKAMDSSTCARVSVTFEQLAVIPLIVGRSVDDAFSISRDAVHPWHGCHPPRSQVQQWYGTCIFPLALHT